MRELEADARERTLLGQPGRRVHAGGGRSRSVDDFLLVSQELPLWGRRGLLGEAAGHEVSARTRRSSTRGCWPLRPSCACVFTDLLLAQDRARSLEAGVGRLDALIAVLRTREEAG